MCDLGVWRKRSKLRLCLSLFNVWSKTVNPCNDYIHLKSFKWTSFSQNEVRHNLPPIYLSLSECGGKHTFLPHQAPTMVHDILVLSCSGHSQHIHVSVCSAEILLQTNE